MSELSNEELLEGLGVEVKTKTKSSLTPRQERIIAGFEDIQRFVEEHGQAPSHGEDKDIFERIYATRLDQIRRQSECMELLKELDHQKLLDASHVPAVLEEGLDDEGILEALGVELKLKDENDITNLQNVKPELKSEPLKKLVDIFLAKTLTLSSHCLALFSKKLSLVLEPPPL